MQRIDSATKVVDLFGAGKHGYGPGNPGTGTLATRLNAASMNHLQEQICRMIEGQGIALDANNYDQLTDAVAAMVAKGVKRIVIDAAVFEASVADGETVYWDAANSRFDEAIADGTAKQNAVGIADVTNAKVYRFGELPDGLVSGLTPGAKYYLSAAVPGALTDVRPAGDAVVIGIAKSATVLHVDIDSVPVLAIGTESLIAGEAIAAVPAIVYQDMFNQRGNGPDRWYLVDTDAVNPVKVSPRVAVAVTTAAGLGSGFTGQVRAGRVGGFAGLTIGSPVWAAATAGGITQTAPGSPANGTQNASVLLGVAAAADEIDFEPPAEIVFTARASALANGSAVTVEHFPDAGARERIPFAYIAVEGYLQIGQGVGTTIGNMTGNAGLSAAFDGTTSQNDVGSASTNATAYQDGSCGKDWGVGQTRRVGKVEVWPSNGSGFSNAAANITLKLMEGAAAPALGNPVDGTELGSLGPFADGTAMQTVTATVAPTDKRYNWVAVVQSGGAGSTYIAEAKFYEMDQLRHEPTIIGSESLNAGTTCTTVRFDDGAGANGDTKTTFKNRTGGAVDGYFEVVV